MDKDKTQAVIDELQMLGMKLYDMAYPSSVSNDGEPLSELEWLKLCDLSNYIDGRISELKKEQGE